jgi:hypothetical protein
LRMPSFRSNDELLLGNAELRFRNELSSRPERSGVERSAVLFTKRALETVISRFGPAAVSIAEPRVTAVWVDGASNSPGNSDADGEVALDINQRRPKSRPQDTVYKIR